MRTDRDGQPTPGIHRDANIKKHMEHLLGLCRGLIADRVLNDNEVYFLDAWLLDHPEIEDTVLGPVLCAPLRQILADGKITTKETDLLISLLKNVTGDALDDGSPSAVPMLPTTYDDSIEIIVPGNTFCITGKSLRPRREIADMIDHYCGRLAGGVSKKVDYLVICDMASRDWVASSFGTKIIRAIELREKGSNITMISERALYKEIFDQSA